MNMADLTRDDILKLARLSRIDLTDVEVDAFAGELTAILGYVEHLDSVDVGDREPTSQVTGLENVTRKDEIRGYGYAPEKLLENVPETEDDQIRVKRMIG